MESEGNFTGFAGFGEVTLVSNLIYGVGYGLIILVTVISNALIVLAYITNASVRKRVCNVYVVSLACADLMTGALVMLFYYVARLRLLTAMDSTWSNSCRVWLTLKYIAINASFYSVLLISYDRYLLVTDTFNYKSHASRKVASIRVLVVWIWSVSFNTTYIVLSHVNPKWNDLSHLTCGPVLSSNSVVFQIFIFLEPIMLFTSLVVINCLMFAKMYYGGSSMPVRKNMSKRSQSRIGDPIDSDVVSNLPEHIAEDENGGNERNNNSMPRLFPKPQLQRCKLWVVSLSRNSRGDSVDAIRKRKTAITLSVLVVTFVICWFPFFTYIILGYYDVIEITKKAMELVTNILLLNSTLNPFLYGLRNARIMHAVRLLCSRKKGRKNNV